MRYCGMEIPLKPNDVIQCRECGYRILYKKRTRRILIKNLLHHVNRQLLLFSMRHAEEETWRASFFQPLEHHKDVDVDVGIGWTNDASTATRHQYSTTCQTENINFPHACLN
ncbi:hypothetical protein GBA52_018038 [Prunus armeniaca]|nr:hypothetical protein GBA52_018038 [Prunus armeniaca]